jgi:tetratricopeptide (TPR) repeat protein
VVVAILLAIFGPVSGIVLSLWRFYNSPTIFAFDPFFGFFSGTLYDTVVEATGPLLTYRLGSALTLVSAAVLAAHLVKTEDGRPALRNLHRPGVALFGAATATASLMLVLEGWRLGHWQTAATITRDLGAQVAGARCDVVYPRSMREEQARLFARDCDQQLKSIERYFEVDNTGRLTAYLFQNAAEKRRLMGAGDTFIAKPWRHEVYLQAAGFPHPVLAHEIAHVVAASFGSGPFRIAGEWGGLKPNPGLIEGVAVAASPDEDVLEPMEWARAMLDLKLLPPLKQVFALGFLGENASKSYTVAGAFVGWVRGKFGAATVRKWYQGDALPKLTQASWADLEARFREHVEHISLPDAARAIAKARFDRPSVWGRKCPHAVDLYRKQAEEAGGRGDYIEAMRTYERLLGTDPHDEGAQFDLAGCFMRRGDTKEAQKRLSALAGDESASRIIRNRALATLADLDLANGDTERAAQRYAQLAARTIDEDALRTIEVKMGSLGDPRARKAIAAFLVGTPERGIDSTKAGALLGAWIGEDPTDGLPEYLLGRDLLGRGMYAEAAERFDRALAKRLPPGMVLREALRQRVVVACALSDTAAARHAYDIWADKGEQLLARKESLKRLLERCSEREVTRAGP